MDDGRIECTASYRTSAFWKLVVFNSRVDKRSIIQRVNEDGYGADMFLLDCWSSQVLQR